MKAFCWRRTPLPSSLARTELGNFQPAKFNSTAWPSIPERTHCRPHPALPSRAATFAEYLRGEPEVTQHSPTQADSSQVKFSAELGGSGTNTKLFLSLLLREAEGL